MRKKRITGSVAVALALLLLMLITAMPAFAEGEIPTSGDFGPSAVWSYDVSSETLYVEGTGGTFEPDEEGCYPEEFTGYPWWGQDIMPFSVVLGEGITSIGPETFMNCTGLNEIQLPNTLQSIGAHAFEMCEIETFFIPDGISYMDPEAFSDMNCTPTLLFTESNTYALDYAKKNNIRYRILQTGVGGSFGSGLTWNLNGGTLTISGRGPIPDYNYKEKKKSYCRPWEKYVDQIRDVVIGDGITRIGKAAFLGIEANSMHVKIMGNTLKSVGDAAFNQSELVEINLPDSVEIIEEDAFSYSRLKEIVLPSSLHTLGAACFRGCFNATSVTFTGPNLKEIPEMAFQQVDIETVKIPEGVEYIGDEAFADCYRLRTVELPDSLKIIGEWSFAYDAGLESITFPPSLEALGESAFRESGLKGISLEGLPLQIGANAFRDCVHFETVDTLEDAEYIGRYAFHNTPYENSLPAADENGLLIYGHTLVRCMSDKAEVTVPEGITAIGEYAFVPQWDKLDKDPFYSKFSNDTLKHVNLPDSLKYIGEEAFHNCRSLAEARIPDGVKSIGLDAFMNCSSMKELKLPKGSGAPDERVTLDIDVFRNCKSLTSVTIPATIRHIPNGCFENCKKLSVIQCEKPLDSIEAWAFSGCSIKKILPTSDKYKVIEVGVYNSCPKLNNIVVPASVTEIQYAAFGECKSLRTITIPSSVKKIDKQTFTDGSRDVVYVKTIRGHAGSKAQKFARKHHLKFVKLKK